MEYIITPDQAKEMTDNELQAIIEEKFSFDNFAWQRENGIKITEPFRADGLNRVLYKCPDCLAEGQMLGNGITLTCKKCGSTHTLTEDGTLASDSKNAFTHIPDWFAWQRKCVKEEIDSGKYNLDIDVDICALVNTKGLYKIGSGNLRHTGEGFTLTGCDGKLSYTQKPKSLYTLNSDFFWYEIGDVISIGNQEVLYYCFPKSKDDIVTKARLATEEIFKQVDTHNTANA
jgi:hypothetical protein